MEVNDNIDEYSHIANTGISAHFTLNLQKGHS